MQHSKKCEWLQKLIAIQDQGKLGELIERFSYCRREVHDYDALTYTHAQLDAAKIGKAAGLVLDLDPDEMAEIAVELMAPNRDRQLGKELIDELLSECGTTTKPVVATTTTTPSTERSLAW